MQFLLDKYPLRVYDVPETAEYPLGVFGEEEPMEDRKQCCGSCDQCARTKRTPRSDEERRQLDNRLNRMIGQLNGIRKMLDENRYCGDILTQIAAVESALQAMGYLILKEHMQTCVAEGVRAGDDAIMVEAFELMKKLK